MADNETQLGTVVPLGSDAPATGETPAVVPLGADAPEPESGERTVETGGVVYKLKTVETKTMEEDEEVTFTVYDFVIFSCPCLTDFRRAKLYRFEVPEGEAGEWKERGTGDLKLLKHKETGKIRVLMRRDITLKICANHYGKIYSNL